MEIDIRKLSSGLYLDVNINHGDTKIALGLADIDEATQLLETLLEAAATIAYNYATVYGTTDKAIDVARLAFDSENEKRKKKATDNDGLKRRWTPTGGI